MVPTLYVGTRPVTLRVTEPPAAQNTQWTQSAKGCIPTQSVGTINARSAKKNHQAPRSPSPRKEGTTPQAGPDVGVPFSLVTFSWANKRK